MKTIRWKFMSTFIIATTALMVIVLILFNIAIRIYFERNARSELKNTFSTMNILVERQLMRSVVNTENAEEALLSLSAALTASKLTANTEFFIFDHNFDLKFPMNTEGTLLNNALLRKIVQYNFDGDGALEKIRTPSGVFFVAGMPLRDTASGELYIVFIAGMEVRNELIGAINLFLVTIMLVSLIIGIFYAIASAKSLTRPIQKVSAYAKEIGNGNFIAIPPDNSCLETSALIESINEMSGRLKTSDLAQRSFLQNASHELRTPLMSIQGYSEAIEKGIGYDPKQAAAIIKSESIRLTTLVEELITLSKIDNSIFDKAFERIDLGDAISESVYRLNGLAMKDNKTINPALEEGVVISGDDNLLSKVLGNVISNCLRYAKTEVMIHLENSEKTAVISISDDGDGFSADDLPHIFERFYKGKGGKFGLGLAIAQKALEIMDGTIEAKNGSTGAIFVIKLPLLS